jgi:hypothetical protein
MPIRTVLRCALAIATLGTRDRRLLCGTGVHAADFPVPKQADRTAPGFPFHTGEAMHDLRLHHTRQSGLVSPSTQPCYENRN